ncbi:phosphopantetheine-binding protein [Rhodococcus fascians]|uniref:acyl carrier protein n=1 Tax=Rhodococcoides fascians TaxID=1828 RepID=UPI0024B815EB|nr:phosphopantetheine-binding protein [Rhodococcus fascians]MDJ0005838.1 phosphopantetheine-binding protein [Rhodococcus fascians]
MTVSDTADRTIAHTVVECINLEVPSVPLDVDRDAELAAYGLNSMKAVEVLFGLEDAFHISIEEDELADDTFVSVQSIVDFLVKEKNVADH